LSVGARRGELRRTYEVRVNGIAQNPRKFILD
jgi:hypothetical protein